MRSAKSSTRYHLVPSGSRSPENDLEVGALGEAEISDIERSALLVDRVFAGSRENGQYSWGFGSPGEWRRLADRAEWGFLAHFPRVQLAAWWVMIVWKSLDFRSAPRCRVLLSQPRSLSLQLQLQEGGYSNAIDPDRQIRSARISRLRVY